MSGTKACPETPDYKGLGLDGKYNIKVGCVRVCVFWNRVCVCGIPNSYQHMHSTLIKSRCASGVGVDVVWLAKQPI